LTTVSSGAGPADPGAGGTGVLGFETLLAIID
jgi:hypothetical protein